MIIRMAVSEGTEMKSEAGRDSVRSHRSKAQSPKTAHSPSLLQIQAAAVQVLLHTSDQNPHINGRFPDFFGLD